MRVTDSAFKHGIAEADILHAYTNAVRLVEVEPAGFVFAGVDMVDGTPLLDVKPYVARFDVPPGVSLDGPVRSGWFDGADMSAPHTPASLSGDPPGAAR